MKKVVTIGGGTGTFVVLTALKNIPNVSLSALVTTADDGGSTGHLRDAYGFLPVGDVRQALVALSEEEAILRRLFAYRFSKGNVTGHSLGNLLLTALTDILGSETRAIEEAADILRVRGEVIPVSNKPATLMAHLQDGTVIRGEHEVDVRDSARSPIRAVQLETEVALSDAARTAIREADVIVLGPGDLYASTAAALLVSGMKDAIMQSRAKLFYIVNLFTKAGQTGCLGAKGHMTEIAAYAGREPDTIFVSNDIFAPEVLAIYEHYGECAVVDDFNTDDARVFRSSLASVVVAEPVPGDSVPRSFIRHDSDKLKRAFEPFLS